MPATLLDIERARLGDTREVKVELVANATRSPNRNSWRTARCAISRLTRASSRVVGWRCGFSAPPTQPVFVTVGANDPRVKAQRRVVPPGSGTVLDPEGALYQGR